MQKYIGTLKLDNTNVSQELQAFLMNPHNYVREIQQKNEIIIALLQRNNQLESQLSARGITPIVSTSPFALAANSSFGTTSSASSSSSATASIASAAAATAATVPSGWPSTPPLGSLPSSTGSSPDSCPTCSNHDDVIVYITQAVIDIFSLMQAKKDTEFGNLTLAIRRLFTDLKGYINNATKISEFDDMTKSYNYAGLEHPDTSGPSSSALTSSGVTLPSYSRDDFIITKGCNKYFKAGLIVGFSKAQQRYRINVTEADRGEIEKLLNKVKSLLKTQSK
jgi:hypothetical protein